MFTLMSTFLIRSRRCTLCLGPGQDIEGLKSELRGSFRDPANAGARGRQREQA